MKRLLVIAGLLALCAYPAKAGNFSSFTNTGESHSGTVEVTGPGYALQWAAAFGDINQGQRTITYSYGPKGNYILDSLPHGDQSMSQSGYISAGTYSYYQMVSGYSGYSNLTIGW